MTGGLAEAEGITWIAFPSEATIADADIRLENGALWIAPRPGNTISLDGIAFAHAVPLVLGSTLGIGGETWPVQALSAIVAGQSSPAAVSA